MRVIALIPAFNEENTIADTVAAAAAVSAIDEVVVIDDGSRDGTAEAARGAGATVLSTPRNLGKGGAVKWAMGGVRGDVIVMIDGDVGSTASEAEKLLAPVLANEADMTIGVFPPRKEGKGGLGFAKGFAAFAIKRMTGKEIREPLSGQRAIKTGVVGLLKFDHGYGLETGITIDALRMGARVVEVPVEMTHAHTSRDIAGFKHRGKQFAAIVRAVVTRIGPSVPVVFSPSDSTPNSSIAGSTGGE